MQWAKPTGKSFQESVQRKRKKGKLKYKIYSHIQRKRKNTISFSYLQGKRMRFMGTKVEKKSTNKQTILYFNQIIWY